LATGEPKLLTTRGIGRYADRAFRTVASGAGLLVLAILALILVTTGQKAWPAIHHEGLSYFTSKDWVPNQGHLGAFAFIYGTALISLIAMVFAVPVSIGIALFSTEVAPRRVRTVVISVMDLLAAVPSVVFGLWGVLVLAPNIVGTYNWWSDTVSPVPVLSSLFDHSQSGRSFFTAGLILAVMVIPIVTSVTREVFATVPMGDKEGALALGATRWEMVKGGVFPHSIGGMVGAVMLGLGRAMGETIAVALVIGSTPQVVANLFAAGDAMPAVIANQFGEASGDHRAGLIGLGVALFLMTVIVNVVARLIVGRIDRRLKGVAA
jgi:phosphate transport system permease protein